MKKVGILALQGSFAEHGEMLQLCETDFVWVKTKENLKSITHLIIPGGESTTLLKLLNLFGLWADLESRVQHRDLQILGTCAGAILCEKLGMPIEIERNAYGAQQASCVTKLQSEVFPDLNGVFIRAPKIKIVETSHCNVSILAKKEEAPVMVEWENFIALSFHPELSKSVDIYKYFLAK